MISCYLEGSFVFCGKICRKFVANPVDKAILYRENDLIEKIRPKKENTT